MTQDVWPNVRPFESGRSQSNAQNLPCPYILSRKLLGTGSYANVYECKDTVSGHHLAAKKFEKRRIYGNESMLQREFQVLKRISRGHPNILSMVDYFETSDYFYLVTDLAAGGELFERITASPQGKLSVSETSNITAVLLSAISHLHKNGIVHRDIKAENILFASKSSRVDSLLLADFGQAAVLNPGESVHTVEGTLSYLAPEVLSKTGHRFPVDIWAVGVLTYFMLCGYMPFDCDTDAETKELIGNADYVFEPEEYWADVPESARSFISECFTIDPKQRLTADAALQHAFLRPGAPQLKPAFSSNSLQVLHEAVLKLQQSTAPTRLSRKTSSNNILARQASSSNLALRHKLSGISSRCSFEDLRHILQGEKCHSPETVTAFTTPVTSASVSRQTSMVGLDSLMQELSSPKTAAPKITSTGSAKFTL